jgi:hypothetical protein
MTERAVRAAVGTITSMLLVSWCAGQSLFDVAHAEENRIAVSHMLAPLERVPLPEGSFKLIDAACDVVVDRFAAITGTEPAGEGQHHGVTCYFVRGSADGVAPTIVMLEADVRAAGFDLLRDDDVTEIRLRRQAWQGDGVDFVIIDDSHLSPDLLILMRVADVAWSSSWCDRCASGSAVTPIAST